MKFKKNYFCITGGPGSGKTTLVYALNKKGCICTPESGRKIIQEQVSAKGDALPWKDKVAFSTAMLAQDISTYDKYLAVDAPVFFDRSIIDVLGYSCLESIGNTEAISLAAQNYRYNSYVFITPPWKEIYKQDTERRQSYEEARATYNVMKDVYEGLGYQLIILPLSSVEHRIVFVLDHVRQVYTDHP